MQKEQNNLSIENVVTKYRNYVATHCPKFVDCCEWKDDEGNWHLDEIQTPASPNANADEQLLLALYKTVAGESVDSRICEALLDYDNTYQKAALSEDEFGFLCENFSDVVSYEFDHRDEWADGAHARTTTNSISEERVRLVKEHVKPQKGVNIFIADAEYCDIAVLFPDCFIYGFTGMLGQHWQQEVWALGQIRLYAAGIRAEIVPGEEIDEEYIYTLPSKGSMDVVIFRANGYKYGSSPVLGSRCNDIEALFELLKPEAKMLYFTDSMYEMAGKDIDTYRTDLIISFRNKIVSEKSISSIVEYEDEAMFGDGKESCLLVIVEKKHNSEVMFTDDRKSKSFFVKAEALREDMLWPSFYSTKRPEIGIPLSELVTFIELKHDDLVKGDDGWELSEDSKKKPVVVPAIMAKEYKDANLLLKKLDLAGSPDFNDQWRLLVCSINEPCALIYGSKDKLVVGYINKLPETGIATLPGITCLVPRDGIDVRYIAALLLTPEVKDQIVSICQGNINSRVFPLIMDKVIVPNHSEKERLSFLSEANYDAMLSSQMEMKQEHKNYTKAVRMRKHALTQTLSSIEAMFYALNEFRIRQNGSLENEDVISRVNRTTVREAFDFISKNLEDMMPALEHIAAVDYTFEKPEWIDPELFIEEYIKRNENGWLNFKPIMMWEKGHNMAYEDIKDPLTGDIIVPKGISIRQFLFPKDALEHVFNNIISNAEAHGFDNITRNDYQIRFSWHMDGIALVVEVDNNGSPISNEIDASSLLEYGVSTALHHDGHNGIGCNEIDDIMQRYDGKVEIVSSSKDEFPVKYILTFYRSNIVLSL